jgi:hypothetical protein
MKGPLALLTDAPPIFIGVSFGIRTCMLNMFVEHAQQCIVRMHVHVSLSSQHARTQLGGLNMSAGCDLRHSNMASLRSDTNKTYRFTPKCARRKVSSPNPPTPRSGDCLYYHQDKLPWAGRCVAGGGCSWPRSRNHHDGAHDRALGPP